ncbi:c-type cytochrome [Parapedobacter sp. 10938]|uniref:c-type cytochrome n=1 Tax=Parapedobacter flavus TaxID=3110225 RepID=UPI002DBD9838|nr:cytochrome c [Parapedobacter sp. 10938]MEC3880359.1 cytochrome c [Parapedobacter sp. 10938]
MRNRCLILVAGLLSLYMVLHSCQSEQAIRTAQYTVNGKDVYTTHCQNCHGANGEGLGKLYPPLTDSTFLSTHREQLACIVKYGKAEMPANPTLSPIEIAYVLTYIGNSFGHSMDMFTQEEIHSGLKACRDSNGREE